MADEEWKNSFHVIDRDAAARAARFPTSKVLYYSVTVLRLSASASQPRPYNTLLHLTAVCVVYRRQSWGRRNFVVSCSVNWEWWSKRSGLLWAQLSSDWQTVTFLLRGKQVHPIIFCPFLNPVNFNVIFLCVRWIKLAYSIRKHNYGKIWIKLLIYLIL